MQSITVRNVNHALPLALALLRDTGKRVAPRGLETLEIVGPFATTYTHPNEMVLFDPLRDANPFFHFFEALWILQGRQDVSFLAWFLPRMADFSDDGKVFHAPYGYRLREGFGFDQIEFCVKALRGDPDTRQAVMSIWHPGLDWKTTKDKPCNDMVMFKIREGKLRMTVCNRSNDAVLGAYGANVVQFSTLLRYVAAMVGVEVGEYTQMSDSFHVYTDNPYWKAWSALHTTGVEPHDQSYEYDFPNAPASYMTPVEVGGGEFDEDMNTFFANWDKEAGPGSGTLNERNYLTNSFVETALPMLNTLVQWRAKNVEQALFHAHGIAAIDWRMAALAWLNRRIARGV